MKSMKLLLLMIGSLSSALLFGAADGTRIYVKNDSSVDLDVKLQHLFPREEESKSITKSDKNVVFMGTMRNGGTLSYYYEKGQPLEQKYTIKWEDVQIFKAPAVLVTISYKRGWVPGTWEFTSDIKRYDDLSDDSFEHIKAD